MLLRFPILLVAINHLFSMLVIGKIPDGAGSMMAESVAIVVGIIAIFLAGWTAITDYSKSLWKAAWLGATVFFIDIVLFGGLRVFFESDINSSNEIISDGVVLMGMVTAFILLSPLALLLGACGGWVKRKLKLKNQGVRVVDFNTPSQ